MNSEENVSLNRRYYERHLELNLLLGIISLEEVNPIFREMPRTAEGLSRIEAYFNDLVDLLARHREVDREVVLQELKSRREFYDME